MFASRGNKSTLIVILLLSVVVSAFLLIWNFNIFDSSPRMSKVSVGNLQIQAKTQPQGGRVFRDVDPELETRIDGSTGTTLYRPSFIKPAPGEDFLVLDFGRKQLLRFDRAGNQVCSYGRGEGEGPGEFVHPIDYDIKSSGRVMIADADLRRLSVFNADCEFVSTRNLEAILLHRFALTSSGDGGFLFTPALHRQEKGVFYSFGSDGLETNFGRLLPKSAPTGLPLDGYITSLSGDLVYAPIYYPVIIRYDSNGSPLWVRTTIDHGTVAAPQSASGKSERPTPKTHYMRTVSADAEGIYTYAHRPSRDSGRTVIDVYDRRDGRYKFSYRFPFDFRLASIAKNKLYTVRDTSALVYRMPKK